MTFYKDPATGKIYPSVNLSNKTMRTYTPLSSEEAYYHNIDMIEKHLDYIRINTNRIFIVLFIPLLIAVVIGIFYLGTMS